MRFTVQPEAAFSNGRANGPVLVRDDDRQWVLVLRQELDEYYEMIKLFHASEPDQVLLQVSGISARLTEMRAILMRNGGQRANKFRTSEVDPLLDQLKLQAQLHSRLIAVRDLDFRLSGGQT
jgi:hypothetical protein